jgi:serine/threonine-protein kinase
VKLPIVLLLPSDVLLIPVEALSPEVRRQVGSEAGDFAVSRRNARSQSRIIDAAAAELLESFRQPTTIVDAVLRYSQAKELDPEEVLENAFPFLRQLWAARLLVNPDSEEAKRIEPVFPNGGTIGGGVIRQCIQVADDTEVYEVVAPNGEAMAMKISRPGSRPGAAEALAREAVILAHLDGFANPRLRGQGTEEGRPFLLLDWCPGVDAAAAAAVLRERAEPKRLLQLCVAILRTFARLHGQGLIHGDVHPRNVLIGPDGTVKIVDFGFARLVASDTPVPEPGRGGVGYYFEPEYARANLLGEQLPPASAPSEQYGLAALLYFLFSGKHYLDFSLGREDFLKQVAEDTPLQFSARGVKAWPDVERTLRRALLKDPAGRFPSLSAFADELEAAATPPPLRDGSTRSSRGATLLESVVSRLGTSGDVLPRGLALAPTCSVNYGAAGIAFVFYRAACLRGDSSFLSAADLWCARALRDQHTAGAFLCEELDLTDRTIGEVALYHRVSGVHCVRALVSQALGDFVSAGEALRDYVAASRIPCAKLDLTTGSASTLIGCAALYEALPDSPLVDKSAIQVLGNDILKNLWNQLDTYLPIHRCTECNWFGMAHGWAGFLYASLRWCRAAGTALPAALPVRMLELGELARPISGGLGWPKSPGQADQEPWPGWCHGSAGYVHLWLLAYQTLGQVEFLRLAEGCAWYAWQARVNPGASLCCGHAGQAYALLAMYNQGGDSGWLRRAGELAERAFAAGGVDSRLSNSLYKGELGIALLAADLAQPEAACMPLFEPEGWPAPSGSQGRLLA